MLASLVLVLAGLQEGLPTAKEADEALRRLKSDFAGASVEVKVAAVQEALAVRHEKVIRAMADVLAGEASAVRVAAVQVLSGIDHPASAEVLTKAMPANQARFEVLKEILSALGELGYQSACPALHQYVARSGDPHVQAFLPDVVDALGRLGSLASVDPLLELLRKLEGQKHNWPNAVVLHKSTERALHAITGLDVRRAFDWETWWRNSAALVKVQQTRTYWLKETWQRIDVAPLEKAPAQEMVLVAARLVPAAPEAEDRERRKEEKRKRRDR